VAIGDSLSDEQREEFIRSRLVPGAVIYRRCDFTKPPKPKYLVIANVRSDTAVLVINTAINSFVQQKQHLLDCQVAIDSASHGFLDHDSYIDCTEPEYIDTALLLSELMNDLRGLKGNINDKVRGDIINAINDSYTISQAEINLLITSLSDNK
jgi:hypothetical protein